MASERRSRVWRKCRVYFRRFRITVLLVLLGLLGIAIYLELHGLPRFVQRPLLEKLRARGLDLDFSRLRIRFDRGLVAEDVSFGQAQDPRGPRVSAQEVELHLDWSALTRLQFQVNELNLRGARLVWPVGETNAPTGTKRVLAVENIEARLRLLPGDEWALDNFSARFAGARFFLSATVTNASAIRDWKFPRAERTTAVVAWPERLRRLAETLEKISFSTPPKLRLILDGDARDWQSFTARLALSAPDADTPWGQATNVVFKARLFPGAGGELSHVEMNLHATAARTPWADASDFDVDLHLDSVAGQTNLVDGDVTVRAGYALTQWAVTTNTEFTAHWVQSLTNPVPLSGQGVLQAASANTRWGDGTGLRLAVGLAIAPNPPETNAAWAGWNQLQPYELDWACELTRGVRDDLEARKILCAGLWRAPVLSVTNLEAQLFDGSIVAQARLDVATREARFGVASDFDVKKLSPVLPPAANHWLAKYTWVESPRVRGNGLVTLPEWTNRHPDWEREVLPTMRLAGEFAVTNGTYLGIAADWARAHLSFTNEVWRLPDLEASRPDGQLWLTHISDDKTRDYYFGIRSTVDVRAVRPLLTTNAQSGFDLVKFSQAPVIEAELWGRWHENDRIGFRAHVAVTNFAYREQTADSFVAEMRYTNRVLELSEPRVWRGTQVVSAAGVTVDFNTERIHFTNGFSTTEPMAIARAIGPITARHIEPFVFKQPPTVSAEGYVPMENESDADLRLVISGGPFEWWNFKLPRVSGNVRWLGDSLLLTNVQTEFYWGKAVGHAGFDFRKEIKGTDFNFNLTVADANLQMLMKDLTTHSNLLHGRLSGTLVVTNANTDDWQSWNGFGRVRLQDGVIWEIPIFGALSKPLDSMLPGLGSSTLSEASAHYTITKSVIFSDDLEMRAAAMRLHYEGTVDFDGRVKARIEAEPLRDTWIVGRVLSLALWPVAKAFEYKATGTLADPKIEPLYIPKLLLAPFHPFQTIEDLFTNDSKTNAPPVFKAP